MAKKTSNSDFISKVFDQVGTEYSFLEEYNGTDNKIKIKHNKCSHVYHVTPYKFLRRKQRCPKCANNRKKTPLEYKQEFNRVLGEEYLLLSDYKGARERVKVKHIVCGSTYLQIASESISGKGCLKCAQNNFIGGRLKTNDDYLKDFENISQNEYKLLSTYIKDDENVKIEHLKCGNTFEMRAGSFLQRKGCPKCAVLKRSEKQRWTTEMFIEFVDKNSNGEYLVLGNYVNSQTNIKIKHLKCGHIFNPTPRDFVSGTRCPKCKSSRGEKIIYNILRSENIDFDTQFKFEDCRNQRPLPFDFKVKKEDGSFFLIEFQGIQHYQPIEYFGGELAFDVRKTNDLIKKKYCKNNNIQLMEIPYSMSEDEIKKIILKKSSRS